MYGIQFNQPQQVSSNEFDSTVYHRGFTEINQFDNSMSQEVTPMLFECELLL